MTNNPEGGPERSTPRDYDQLSEEQKEIHHEGASTKQEKPKTVIDNKEIAQRVANDVKFLMDSSSNLRKSGRMENQIISQKVADTLAKARKKGEQIEELYEAAITFANDRLGEYIEAIDQALDKTEIDTKLPFSMTKALPGSEERDLSNWPEDVTEVAEEELLELVEITFGISDNPLEYRVVDVGSDLQVFRQSSINPRLGIFESYNKELLVSNGVYDESEGELQGNPNIKPSNRAIMISSKDKV